MKDERLLQISDYYFICGILQGLGYDKINNMYHGIFERISNEIVVLCRTDEEIKRKESNPIRMRATALFIAIPFSILTILYINGVRF